MLRSMYMVEIALYGAIAPLGLLLLSSVWAYPAYLEEVVKWLILKNYSDSNGKSWIAGMLLGTTFGLSEWMLYFTNAWTSGNYEAMLIRLFLTVPMHAITGLIIGARINRKGEVVVVVLAMVFHFLFNYLVGLML